MAWQAQIWLASGFSGETFDKRLKSSSWALGKAAGFNENLALFLKTSSHDEWGKVALFLSQASQGKRSRLFRAGLDRWAHVVLRDYMPNRTGFGQLR